MKYGILCGATREKAGVEYECDFTRQQAEKAVEILNSGRGLDGWCESENPKADLLRDRLIEAGVYVG